VDRVFMPVIQARRESVNRMTEVMADLGLNAKPYLKNN
jgi:hypothetical protein